MFSGSGRSPQQSEINPPAQRERPLRRGADLHDDVTGNLWQVDSRRWVLTDRLVGRQHSCDTYAQCTSSNTFVHQFHIDYLLEHVGFRSSILAKSKNSKFRRDRKLPLSEGYE